MADRGPNRVTGAAGQLDGVDRTDVTQAVATVLAGAPGAPLTATASS